MNNLKLLSDEDNHQTFMMDNYTFKIIKPLDTDQYFFIETPEDQPGYEWLNRINEYIFEKNPTFEEILNKIESDYKNLKKDSFEHFKKIIDDNLINMKSKLSFIDGEKKEVMFKRKDIGEIVKREFFSTKEAYPMMDISLQDNNIFCWSLKFKNFENEKLSKEISQLDKKYIEIEINFHDCMYPDYPPLVEIIRPLLKNNLKYKIASLQMFQTDYWTPTRDMNYIIKKLYEIINEHAQIEHDQDRDKELDILLTKLASLIDLESEQLDKTIYKRMINNEKNNIKTPNKINPIDKVVWKSGTGFSYGYNSGWDINTHLKIVQEKNNQTNKVLREIYNNLADNLSDVKLSTLKNSFLISYISYLLKSTSPLEMENVKFQTIINILTVLSKMETIDIFMMDDLFEEISQIYDKVNKIKKYSEKYSNKDQEHSGSIIDRFIKLFETLDPLYKSFTESIKQANIEKNKKLQEKINAVSDENEIYCQAMQDKKFSDEFSISGFTIMTDQSRIDQTVVKRIAKEFSALESGLPIHYNSSIFLRVDKDDLRKLRVLITGPDDTPYDSGIFIFDVYLKADYPKSPPIMWLVNHGGKRFNPNLYADGKVCLSLLGTWQGLKGEEWNSNSSTLQQLFVSVQSQILVENPFYNEPNYESMYNNEKGNQLSRNYNNNIRYYTMSHAIYDILKDNSFPEFRDVITNHFKLKKNYVLKICKKWATEAYGDKAKLTADKFYEIKQLT